MSESVPSFSENPRKSAFVSDLTPNQRIEDMFVLVSARQGQARNGPFWTLVLQDRTGRIDAKIWSPQSQEYPNLESGGVVLVRGLTGTYRDQIQLTVDWLRELETSDPAVDMAELVPSSENRPEDMLERLEALSLSVLHYPPWRTLAKKLLRDEHVRAKLLAAPGAKAMHHAYLGGLLEHTLSVVELCLKFSDHYPELDREILFLAAILHDLGKAWELSEGPATDYTDQGRLLGHIHIGLEVLEPFLAKCKADADLVMHLKHIILSHHGEYEYGSPKRPKTREAMALHYADNLDAKMNQMGNAFAEAMQGKEPVPGAEAEADSPLWTPYQRSLERFLYKPRPTPGNGAPKKKPAKEENQCSLPLKA